METAVTIAGIVLIAAGLTDMFHTLLHPSGKGRLSRPVQAGVWKLSKATGHRVGSAVGPAAMTAVILLWVLLQGAGWALIYYPHIPAGFTYSPGIRAGDYADWAEALYISFVSLATLGFGDVVATAPWIRLASPLEALTGFALLTAALTWFTQIYPPLSRRRTLALELKILSDNDYAGTMATLSPESVSRLLDHLTAQVATVRIDFTQHAEGYYFQEQNPDLSLARQIRYALLLHDAAGTSSSADVRCSAARLAGALEQLGRKLRTEFLQAGDGLRETLAAYAEDHGHADRP